MTTAPTKSLADLAVDINAEHAACERAMHQGLDHALRCGDLLRQAKRAVTHGQWQKWLEDNFDGTPRLARHYMRVACDYPKLDTERKCVSALSLRQAIGAISASTAKIARADIGDRQQLIEHAEASGNVNLAVRILKQEKREARRSEAARRLPEGGGIITGDMAEVGDRVGSETVDLVFCDPPYLADTIDAYSRLGEFAARVLRPGGVCLP